MINQEKLTKDFNLYKSRDLIDLVCDYCGIKLKRNKNNFFRSRKIIDKDCCGEKQCVSKKRKESCLVKYGVECNLQSPEMQEKIRQTNIKKYGVKYPSQSPEIQEKIRQTNIEKYGVEYAVSSPEIQKKIKQTNIERYGVECSLESAEIQEKMKQNNLKKYGVEYHIVSSKVQDKIRRTNLERYDVEYAASSPKVQEKIKQTNIERYGVEHPAQLLKIKEKTKKTNFAKYGVEYPSQLPEIQDKIRQTNVERYGVEFSLESPETQEKIRQTNLTKYGVRCHLSSPEIQEKIRQTNIAKYGHESLFSSPEIQEKIRQTNIERYGSAYPTHKYGKIQKEIQDWLNSSGFNFKSDHQILNGKELDLYDVNLKFAIEYCGLHWHHENSPQPRLRNYHFDKWKTCKNKKIQLITIFEDEWLNNQEIIKSVLLSKLGKFDKRIYARKCLTKEISKKEFVDFCDQYHVQGGNTLAKVCFGLFYENELVGIMDLGIHHRKKLENEMVLTRLCFKKDYQVIGGSSKLFSACVKWCRNNNINKIISWSDNRWSNGSVYENLKFELVEQLGPDYAYVKISNPKERTSKQSQKKSNSGCPADVTEKAFALQNGLSRIWDCGKIRWEFLIEAAKKKKESKEITEK